MIKKELSIEDKAKAYDEAMSHIIDADKLLEFVEEGMEHSRLCSKSEPVIQNGKYDVISDMIRRMDLFTYN